MSEPISVQDVITKHTEVGTEQSAVPKSEVTQSEVVKTNSDFKNKNNARRDNKSNGDNKRQKKDREHKVK